MSGTVSFRLNRRGRAWRWRLKSPCAFSDPGLPLLSAMLRLAFSFAQKGLCMKSVMLWLPAVAIAIVLCASKAPVYALSKENAARVDSLYKKVIELAERDSLAAEAARFERAIRLNKEHLPSYVGLGHVHLKRGDLKAAEKAFRQALRKRKNHAPALNGPWAGIPQYGQDAGLGDQVFPERVPGRTADLSRPTSTSHRLTGRLAIQRNWIPIRSW